MASGRVSSATCSTQATSFSCFVGTVVWLTWSGQLLGVSE
jgi:hypothetical protein